MTVVRDEPGGVFCFVGYDPLSLRVRWTQRAPGSVEDPRGLNDHRGREGLWRAFLDGDFRQLLDRFAPADVVDVAEQATGLRARQP
ncbi:MAG: hypothetical protein Q8O67_22645 [Deltaproteobacteria bacterium]|nr:hypothetical protein [Deltaproteobacteria bacterium]